MTSMQIAEATGKQHKDVLRAIRNMEPAWEKSLGRKFALQFRTNKLATGGEIRQPYYELTKTECLYIATKFNDEARARLILRWEELENERAARRQPVKGDILPLPMYNALCDSVLVEVVDGRAVTTSRKLAEVLGRKHDSVLDTIKANLHLRPFKYGNFIRRPYSSRSGHGYEFMITRKGLDALAGVMRCNAAPRIEEAYAGAWNSVAAKSLPASASGPTRDGGDDDTVGLLSRWVDELRGDLRRAKNTLEMYVSLYANEETRRRRNGDMAGYWHDLYEDLLWRVVNGTEGTVEERMESHRAFRDRISRQR